MYTIKDIDLSKLEIKTKKDVRTFVEYVLTKLNVCYHPDDSFFDVIDIQTEEATFDDEAAEALDNANDACFDVAGEKYYDICIKVFDKVEKERASK